MSIPLRVLIIEDSEDDALLEIHHIEKGDYQVEYEVVQSAESLGRALAGNTWDVLLCDYQMPHLNGYEALKIYRQSGQDAPFIIISGTIGEEIAVECMKAGADDYLMKGNLARLLPAIERGLREARNRADRRRAEEEIKRAEAKRFELERELMHAQKMESLGTLASGIAHDFNNILGIILGYSNLGEQKAGQPELIRCFESISSASQRGALLVRQLLTFARKTETVFRRIDVNSLIAEMASFFQDTFPKTICISTDLQPDIPRIVADATQLHQVFMNLCVNARDAMPAGGSIKVATRMAGAAAVKSRFPKADDRPYLEISVSDTGSGMDEKTKRKIFDPFFTTKEPGKGTGLGLSLVHSILENHRGMIDVESEPGEGTAFRLYLPVEETAEAEGTPATDEGTDSSGGTETVLLIEDEALIIDMVRTFLADQGYSVLHARDGEEGLAMFSRHRNEIGVVILDSGLPKMRGDQVAIRIKNLDPGAKIILMSGFFDPEVRKTLSSLGVDHLIQKPFKLSELGDCLRSVIDAEA